MSLLSGLRLIVARLSWPPSLPIRVRLTLWNVAILAAILLGFCAFLYFSLSRSLYQEIDAMLAATAAQQQANLDLENGLARLDGDPSQIPAGTAVALYDRTSDTLLGGTTRWPAASLAAARGKAVAGETSYSTVRLTSGEAWRVLAVPVRENGRVTGVLEIGRPERDVEAALKRLLLLMGIAVPGVLGLAAAGGLFLAQRALSPIDRITRTARRIGAEDLSQRLGLAPSKDEVGQLAVTFDDMLERLDCSFQRQRQFTADASHELRTPLAIISSQAEVALERPRQNKEYQQALRVVHGEAERMRKLVSDLLTLARADAGQETLEYETISLDELAGEVAAQFTPLATARGLHFTLDLAGNVVVLGDQTRLMQLLLNLVDNAVKHVPAGGRITIATRQREGWAMLAVADTGSGIAAEHLPHLFERFYRVDKARSREEGGTGLGLAIGDWIARAHGGHIEVTSVPGQGSTFTVHLRLVRHR